MNSILLYTLFNGNNTSFEVMAAEKYAEDHNYTNVVLKGCNIISIKWFKKQLYELSQLGLTLPEIKYIIQNRKYNEFI